GMVDVLIGLWFNEQRASNFLYSDPYYVNQISFISDQSEVISYQKLDDLKGLKIGVRKGASFGHNFDNAAGLNKTPMVNALSMLKMLALGRIDIGIGDHLILSRLMQKNKMLNEQLKFVEPAYTERELHMAIVKSLADHQAIVSAFNHHLRKMKQQGRVKEIIKTYSP
ncbi:ABC transporter substrate-binding protein, partial [Oleiphilus sp. HI0132]